MSVPKRPPEGADLTEHQVSTRLAYDGPFIKVRRDEVRLPDGKPSWREYVEHPGAVMVLAFPEPGTIVLERQFRYPHRRHFIELPAGKIDPEELPEATGRRELREECGFEAGTWRALATVDACIGYSTERIHLFEATGLVQVGARLDEGEHLEVFTARFEEALAWVREGIITDTKTTFGILWWAQWGSRT